MPLSLFYRAGAGTFIVAFPLGTHRSTQLQLPPLVRFYGYKQNHRCMSGTLFYHMARPVVVAVLAATLT